MKRGERTTLTAFQRRLAEFRDKLGRAMDRVDAIDPPLTDSQKWQTERAVEAEFAPDLDTEAKRLKGAQGRN